MSYCTPYCSWHGYDEPEEPIDFEAVNALIAEFGIPESEAIEWIEGMGYALACEEIRFEQEVA